MSSEQRVTFTENFVKFGREDFETYARTDARDIQTRRSQ